MVGVAALAGALVLLFPGKSEAQRGGFGGTFGAYRGGGYGGGYGGGLGYGGGGLGYGGLNYGGFNNGYGGYRGIGYGGYGYPGYGYGYGTGLGYGWQGNSLGYGATPYYGGYGYAPGYYGSGYNYPNYAYSPGGTAVTNATYNPGYYNGNANNASTSSYQSFYPQVGQQGLGNSAEVNVRVPASAELWFDNHKTRQTGLVRQFITPPLEQGKSFTYNLRARWTENGAPMDQTRTVEVQAGRQASVDFTAPPQGGEQPANQEKPAPRD